jgi:hypothetical protein
VILVLLGVIINLARIDDLGLFRGRGNERRTGVSFLYIDEFRQMD